MKLTRLPNGGWRAEGHVVTRQISVDKGTKSAVLSAWIDLAHAHIDRIICADVLVPGGYREQEVDTRGQMG